MKQIPGLIASSKILVSKQYTSGSVYMAELTPEMLVVLAYNKTSDEPFYSRAYFYNLDTKKAIQDQARKQFNFIKECLIQKKLYLIEEFD